MRAMVLAACLSLALSGPAFGGVTGGLYYYLGVFHEEGAETTVTLTSVKTEPFGAEVGMPVGGTWQVPARRPPSQLAPGDLYLKLGRIEYGVPIADRRTYTTTIVLILSDTVAGATTCTFVFNVLVRDQAFGPVALVGIASANGIDSDAFLSLNSDKRCQVFPATGQGPSMYIHSQPSHVP